jgi:protein tyrosine phosphatase domain-containing protein 1
MQYVTITEGRKVAVHCHAGLGRTGLAIACHLVFTRANSAGEAVLAVRRSRPGALQTRKQELFVHVFEQYVKHLR